VLTWPDGNVSTWACWFFTLLHDVHTIHDLTNLVFRGIMEC